MLTTGRISGIYTITNRENGKVYIGETLDIYRRWNKEHLPSLINNTHYNKKLQQDYNKYGKESFHLEILEQYYIDNPITTKARLLILESYYIQYFKKMGFELYNSENSLIEILHGNKDLDNKALFGMIIYTLKNFYIDNCDGFLYFEKRISIEDLLFSYIEPDKYITKTDIQTAFEKFIEKEGYYLDNYIFKYNFAYVKDGKNNFFEIREIKKEKQKEIEKIIVSFLLEFDNNGKTAIKKNKLKETGKDQLRSIIIYEPKDNEMKFSVLFKEFANMGLIPKDYEYSKIREYLISLNLIELKKINGLNITFATDKALNENILKPYSQKYIISDKMYQYKYVFTNYGIKYMKKIFSDLIEDEKIKLFTSINNK